MSTSVVAVPYHASKTMSDTSLGNQFGVNESQARSRLLKAKLAAMLFLFLGEREQLEYRTMPLESLATMDFAPIAQGCRPSSLTCSSAAIQHR